MALNPFDVLIYFRRSTLTRACLPWTSKNQVMYRCCLLAALFGVCRCVGCNCHIWYIYSIYQYITHAHYLEAVEQEFIAHTFKFYSLFNFQYTNPIC